MKKEKSRVKKPLAIILLLFGALLVFFIAAFAYVLIFLNVGGFGLLINIAATLAAGIGVDRLRRLFRKKYGLKAPLFFVCAYLLSIIGSVVYLAVFAYLDSIGYFVGFLAGLGELILGIAWLVTAAAFTAVGGLYLLFSFIIQKSEGAVKSTPKSK